MLTDGECRSVAVTILETVGVVMIYCFLGNFQIITLALEECDDGGGIDDIASLEDSQTESDENSEVELVQRQTPTSEAGRRLQYDSKDPSTNMAPLVRIVTSIATFFEIRNKNLYGLFGFEDPSQGLMTALVQLLHIVTSIIEYLQRNRNKLYCQFGSDSGNLMTSVVDSVDNVTYFAESLQNHKKNVYEELKALKGLSKQDCIRAMIMFVKDEHLVAYFMSAHGKYKEAYVKGLLDETPIESRNDYWIGEYTTTTLKDLQTQSEYKYAVLAHVLEEGSEVESVQRHDPASNKSKIPCSDSEHPILPLLEELAKAISSIVEFFKKPCEKRLYQRLMTLSDLSKKDFIRARLLLMEDQEMAEVFMVLDEEHRLDFVLMLLGKAQGWKG